MSSNILLYDLSRRTSPPRSWSYNVWKTRLVLNYKSIPYTTVWVDHNTLAPTISSLGLPPAAVGFPYTVPTLTLDKDAARQIHITDSAIIAQKLEILHPQPALNLDAELEAKAEEIVHKIAMPLFAVYMPRVARDVIAPETVETFKASREKRFGASLGEMEKRGGGEKAWSGAKEGFNALKRLLSEGKVDEGPFLRGSKVCYADFILVALFESFKRVGDDLFARAVTWDESFGILYDAAAKWLEKDD